MPQGVTVEKMCDWKAMAERVATLPALWEPGSATGYHSYTFGWVIGELIRRTDDRKRGACVFIREDLCDPLEMEGFRLGDVPRNATVATVVDARPAIERTGLRAEAIPAHLDTCEAVFGRPDVRVFMSSRGGWRVRRGEPRPVVRSSLRAR